MKRIPKLFNSEEVTQELKLSTRCDKLGNIFYCVEFNDNDGNRDYATFQHLSSSLDFIQSNFK